MDYKQLILTLGFLPKENTSGIYIKKYPKSDNYAIEIDIEKQIVNYGTKIQSDSKTTQNFSQTENFVVLECVNRLLEKGYQPENITLEKVYPSGHGTSGRLDILVTREDGTAYLMIECKTYGTDFENELKNIKKDGGQLFSYFQQDTKAELLMLYASKPEGDNFVCETKIIKVEDEFRTAGNVNNVFNRWNRKFDEINFWDNDPYNHHNNEMFTKQQLGKLTEEAGKKLFHGFATILRKHSVSDKPNAFNVIFNLFLAKLYDEQKGDDQELEFQWKKEDDPVDFQVRLHNLHKEGLNDFLKKEIEGIKDEDFDAKLTAEERYNAKKKFLKFNKFFSIKEVFDDETFDQNQRVLKEIVQLIEKYQIRYPRKQKYLSEFFELLLTTGLKQEVGQYFTPPPVTKFIVKSLPVSALIEKEINQASPKLPAVIDYAAGSGHFITEIMEEYQDIINNLDASQFSFPNAKKKIQVWSQESGEPYTWASEYVYGIEKDYRLVKVAKVGCYFYGDGVAQIIHGDGLDSLTNPPKSYIGLLEQNTNTEDSTKNKFSIVVANPPYSVENCKDDLEYIGAKKEFSLYKHLTYDSSEIECLFVERTKQLLKDGGVAGIILPSSILSNSSEIHIKTREIILLNFEIVAITEFGSKTFMATPTKTVVLFLRRRSNNNSIKVKEFVERFFIDFQDNNPPIPFNTIEKPVTKYVSEIWDTINLNDYISLIKNMPGKNAQDHEFYKEYRNSVEQKIKNEIEKAQKNRKTQLSEEDVRNIRDRIEKDSWNTFIKIEKEKLLYFILAYNQKTIIVNSGNGNNEEKQFLGYYFSGTRGKEGMYPSNGRSTVEECTKLYNEKNIADATKASTYIYKAFNNEYPEIHESLKNNVSCVRLIDMQAFHRPNFDKSISLNPHRKVKIETKWEEEKFGEIADIVRGVTYSKSDQTLEKTETIILTADNITLDGHLEIKKEVFLYEDFNIPTEKILKKHDILMCFSSGSKVHLGKVAFIENDTNYLAGGFMGIIRAKDNVLSKYLFQLLNSLLRQTIRDLGTGANINNLSSVINNVKIPLPPLSIQQQIVSEIEVLEKKEGEAKEQVKSLKSSISDLMNISDSTKEEKLEDISLILKRGKSAKYGNSNIQIIKSGQARGVKEFDFSQKHFVDDTFILDERKLEKGDVLINSTGVGTAGRVTLFNLEGTFVVDSHITILRPNKEKVLPDFILQSLVKIGFKNIEAMALGQSGQIELSLSTIQNIKIPLPALSEQQQIVSEIEQIETKITDLETQLAEIPQQKEAVLKKYL